MVLQTKSILNILILFSIISISCNPNKKNMPFVSFDARVTPVVHSEDVSTLISDSGSVYKLDAKIWEVYSNESDPYSYFPEKMHVQIFDTLFQEVADIVADTAYYFDKRELWHVIENVVIKNVEGKTFETSELFWDTKVPPDAMNAFYTHKPVKISEPDGTVVYGYGGFTADKTLRITRLFSVVADLYITESDTLQHNVTSSDSIRLP